MKVLLAEDDPLDQELFRAALPRAVEYELILAQDGEEAIRLLTEPGEPFALVILDLQLPKATGFEVLAALRSTPGGALVPVVVMSSSREPRDIEAALRGGANAFVWKAVEASRYQRSVAEIERFWLETAERPGA